MLSSFLIYLLFRLVWQICILCYQHVTYSECVQVRTVHLESAATQDLGLMSFIPTECTDFLFQIKGSGTHMTRLYKENTNVTKSMTNGDSSLRPI